MTATAGFLLAAKGQINPGLLLAAVAGVSLVIASACVFNNYLDRNLDNKMGRTKKRALASGTIPTSHALFFAGLIGLSGMALLLLTTGFLTGLVALAGFVVYVLLYTPLKTRSVHATLVGSIAGAVPIVTGYSAVTGRLDAGALLLFLVLVIWQMPHFYAIATYRYYDYFGANVPVLPVKKGFAYTKIVIVLYILAFFAATSLLFVFGVAGFIYFAVMLASSLIWFFMALQGFKTQENAVWGRRVFRFSLVVLLLFCLTISLDHLLI